MSNGESRVNVPDVCANLNEWGRWRNLLIRRQWLIERPAVQGIRTDLRLRDDEFAKLPSKAQYKGATELWKALMKFVVSESLENPADFCFSFGERMNGKFNQAEIDVAVKHRGIAAVDKVSYKFFSRQRKEVEKNIEELASQLPVCEWWVSLVGCASGGLGKIIAETGDLSNYANPDKLKKRLGLSVMKGRAPSTWVRAGGLTKEEWVELGYCPRRRSVMYTIGASIIFVKSPDNRFRLMYEREKEKKIKQKEGDEDWPKGRLDLHARRYMEQQLLIELWARWNGVWKEKGEVLECV